MQECYLCSLGGAPECTLGHELCSGTVDDARRGSYSDLEDSSDAAWMGE